MLKPMQQSSRDMEVRKDLVQERNSIIREICQRYNVMDAMIMATTKRDCPKLAKKRKESVAGKRWPANR